MNEIISNSCFLIIGIISIECIIYFIGLHLASSWSGEKDDSSNGHNG